MLQNKEDKIMRKGLTEIVFILDRSGSMSGLEADTIGGFNSMISKQKKRTERRMFLQFCLMTSVKCFMTECQ